MKRSTISINLRRGNCFREIVQREALHNSPLLLARTGDPWTSPDRNQAPKVPTSCVRYRTSLDLISAPVPAARSSPIIRSYQGESTGSHPNSEVKHPWACSVLRWGTTWESQVTNVLPLLVQMAGLLVHVTTGGVKRGCVHSVWRQNFTCGDVNPEKLQASKAIVLVSCFCSKRRLGRPEILLHDPVWGR